MRHQLIYGSYLAFKGLKMPVTVPSLSIIINILLNSRTQLAEYVNARVLFYTILTVYVLTKKESFTFFPLFKYSIFEYVENACYFTQ